jgi:hypothetical protein
MANRQEIELMIAKLSAAFPNWKVNAYTIQVYLEDLSDIDSEELDLAVKHCRTQPGRAFAPSTGEIRGAVSELRVMARNIPSSFEAWQEVGRQISINGGDFGKPFWSHPLVQKTVEAIGWRNLRMSEDQTADRARFIQCYEQFQERAGKEDILLPEVRGFIEAKGGRLEAPADQIKRLSEGMRNGNNN